MSRIGIIFALAADAYLGIVFVFKFILAAFAGAPALFNNIIRITLFFVIAQLAIFTFFEIIGLSRFYLKHIFIWQF